MHTSWGSLSTLFTGNVIFHFATMAINCNSMIVETQVRTGVAARGKRRVRNTSCPAACRPRPHTVHRGCRDLCHQWPQVTRDTPSYIHMPYGHIQRLFRKCSSKARAICR
uniref:Uncharacterized protein n=1 Tax=Opuntia streptacantha TaxID=393608 RepID=A0A7C8Z8B5_OPUST